MGTDRLVGARVSQRLRRRLTVSFLALVGVAAFGSQQAPYARVSPGPAPDLTGAVVEAQNRPSALDPSFGTGPGSFLATTVHASQLSWWQALTCATSTECAMLPVDTNDPGVRDRAAEQMAQSQSDAAALAEQMAAHAAGFPHARLEADLGSVGGPSAGLMLTLTFLDATTVGDLTGGAVVAGTGTVAASGAVGAVNGVREKVAGAAQERAEVFFVSAFEKAQARAAAPDGLEVVGVDSVDDAVAWLCAHGGRSAACPPQ